MLSNLTFPRRALVASAALLAVVALMVATCLVPVATRVGTLDNAFGHGAPALWTLAIASGVAALLVLVVAVTVRVRSFLATGCLALASLVALLLALFLNDAGMACWAQGTALHGTAFAAFTGAGTCLIVATTVLSTAFLLPGRGTRDRAPSG